MSPPPPDRANGQPEAINRRRMLWLAGGAALAATAAGCSRPSSHPTPSPTATAASAASPTAGLPPAPVASAPPTPSGVPSVLLCRDAWGARPARPGGRPHTVTRMTLHHEGVVLGDNRNVIARLRQDQRYHQDDLGWIDIAYHLAIDRNGNIFELRSPDLAGDTATTYDTTGHFLVLCEGDFDQEEVTEDQLHGTALAFAWAAETFHVASDTLAGHRDFAATSCPGTNLYAHLSSGDLKSRIDNLLSAGTVNLQRVCGAEAAAKVAAIEAGH
jgi:hypothetical protein